jgi:hypothetical protein
MKASISRAMASALACSDWARPCDLLSRRDGRIERPRPRRLRRFPPHAVLLRRVLGGAGHFADRCGLLGRPLRRSRAELASISRMPVGHRFGWRRRPRVHTVFKALDAFIDGFGQPLGLFGERLHFARDDREALAGFTGAGGFDGGVERERLVCSATPLISEMMPVTSPSAWRISAITAWLRSVRSDDCASASETRSAEEAISPMAALSSSADAAMV